MEIILAIAAATALGRIATMEERSMLLWIIVSLLTSVACALLIPLPMINVTIGFFIDLAVYLAWKVITR